MSIVDRIKTAIAIQVAPRQHSHRERPMPPGIPDDRLLSAAEAHDFTRGSDTEYTAEQARAALGRVMSSGRSAADKFDALHLLDIRVQNQTEIGRNAVINEISAAQVRCIKEME